LIVLDGGKPQLGEIWRLFQELKIGIPLVSLAKREEEVFGIISNIQYPISPSASSGPLRGNQYSSLKFKKININPKSSEGFLLQRIRDEAHRFAIGYHKLLRAKKIEKSKLDEIEGIGPMTKKKLLLKFGSVKGIMEADISDLEKVVGKKMVRRVKERL
jgi:excinuclease ABC subunit C